MTVGSFNYKKWLTENRDGEANINYLKEQDNTYQYVVRSTCSTCTDVGSYSLSGSWFDDYTPTTIITSQDLEGTLGPWEQHLCPPVNEAFIIEISPNTDNPPSTIGSWQDDIFDIEWGANWGNYIKAVDSWGGQAWLEEEPADCDNYPTFNTACCNPDSENYGATDTGVNISILDNFSSFLEGVFCDESMCIENPSACDPVFNDPLSYFNDPECFCSDLPDVEYDMTWWVNTTNMCELCMNDPVQAVSIQCCCCPEYTGLPQAYIDQFPDYDNLAGWGGANQCDGSTIPPSTGGGGPTGSIDTGSIDTGSINTGSGGHPGPQGLPPLSTTGSDRPKEPKKADKSAGLTSLDFMDTLSKSKDQRLKENLKKLISKTIKKIK